MPLSPGTRLGPYQITAPLGAGGMGEVYRAHDTTLDRDVAIKVLPEAFAADADRLARFEREAKVLASLNHPNIGAIHGLEQSGDTRALVLELVDGPTLADRIAGGPIPLEEALPIARQIAEALEAAHEAGVIHRDLKPANIKVRDDGTVKVLDFGLAKALEPEVSEADAANSPTLTAAATRAGIIMGTAAYMSPEQARGKPADKRADIWAFGAVLYEMLTGKRPFEGATVSDSLASVLKTDPAWAALPSDTPAPVRRLLRRCLTKDHRDRLQHVGDARVEIKEAQATPDADSTNAATIQSRGWRPSLPVALTAAAITGLVVGLAVWILTRPAPLRPAPVTRTSIVLPQTQVRTNTGRRRVAISPTGTHVVYVANEQLYLRALDELEAQPLAGTEGSNPTLPFFSPDGQWIGFYSLRDQALKKVALSGGAAVTLTEAPNPWGVSWGADDTIVFGRGGQGILRVAGAGGTPDMLVSIDPPAVAQQPQMLPGGEAVLYTLAGNPGQRDAAQIVVEQLATGERTVVVEGGTDARYLVTGHLVYTQDAALLAVPFDVNRLELTGGPVPLVDEISSNFRWGSSDLDISQTGTLVYVPAGRAADNSMVWVTRDGVEEPLDAPSGDYRFPRLSPDGSRIVMGIPGDQGSDIWTWDLRRKTMTRLTFEDASVAFPIWTPDDQRVIFNLGQAGFSANLYWRAADGTGAIERLTDSPNRHASHSISPDGTRVVMYCNEPGSDFDLHVLRLDAERRIEPLIATEFNERNAEVSPDGRWLAYQADVSGQLEVYVQPFSDVNQGRWQISSGGGARPLWGPDGRELFYMNQEGVMGVTIETAAGFQPGTPELIVSGSYAGTDISRMEARSYDISPDGERFLMLKIDPNAFAGLTQIHVVHNWIEELKARVPTGQ